MDIYMHTKMNFLDKDFEGYGITGRQTYFLRNTACRYEGGEKSSV